MYEYPRSRLWVEAHNQAGYNADNNKNTHKINNKYNNMSDKNNGMTLW